MSSEIQALEQAYGINFKQFQTNGWGHMVYTLDHDGKVIFLSLHNCRINDVTPIAALTGLTWLYLSGNQISCIAPLAALKDLARLDLDNNQINDVTPLASLVALKSLYLSHNKISNVTPLASLSKLTKLDLAHNQISDVTPLASLTGLSELYLSNNQVNNIAPLVHLVGLNYLHLAHNQISDIMSLTALTELAQLVLTANQIEDVAPLVNLKKLRHLNLGENRIRIIPNSLLQLPLNWDITGHAEHGLFLADNPLKHPPTEVVKSGQKAIEQYYQRLEQACSRELREAKLILLGEPDAGKSSIVRRLLYNEFDPHSKTTLGADIHRWKFQDTDGEEYRVNIWDFGGQDIQQSIHHLFLTAGALYLVVLDARRDESPLQWLQTIDAFAAGATVLLAVNQIDVNAHPKLNQQELLATYPNIAAVFYTSCKHDQDPGITQLITELKLHLAQLPSMHQKYPQQWFAIKELIEYEQNRGYHYMSMSSYRELCAERGVTGDKNGSYPMVTILRVLDNIGTVRWFRNFEHFDYQVLDPGWLTIGLYHILVNADIKQRGGIVGRQQIQVILLHGIPTPLHGRVYSYRERDIDFFITTMQYYKFAFKVEDIDDESYYIIPKGFPQNPPARLDFKDYEGDDHRLYIIEFTSFAPAWLLHRLIVGLHRSIPEELYWYYGFVYRTAEGDTLVNLFEHERKLFIRVPKNAPNVYPLLRFCLFDIFADTMRLEMQEWVMFGPDNSARASLQQLRRYADKGIQLYRDHDTLEEAPVAELLGLFPANIANADTTTALKELEILKTERQQDRKLINKLIDLIQQLQNQSDENQQVSTVTKIRGYMDLIHTSPQNSATAQGIIRALGKLDIINI